MSCLYTFTGWLLKSEWDDSLIEGQCYSSGKHELTLNTGNSKNRIAECDIYYFTYYTYNGHSCGTNCYSFEIIEHRTYYVSCSGGGGGSGYPYSAPGGGGGSSGGSGDGGFHIPEFAPNTTEFELEKARCIPGGIDRTTVNNNLATAMTALGIFSGVAGLSNSMIEALVKSIGGSNQGVKVIQTVLGKSIGTVTFVWGGYEAVMGLIDGDISEEDMLNVLEAVAAVGMVVSGGWLAVGFGAVNLGIALYQTATSTPPSCD